MKRKIIQISTTGDTLTKIYALCDDGTIWLRSLGEWNEVDAIPQPEEAGASAPKEVSIPPCRRALLEGEHLEVGDFCDGYPVSGFMLGLPITSTMLGTYTRPIK